MSRWSREGDLYRAAWTILVPAVWAGALALAAYVVWVYAFSGQGYLGYDAHAYWLAGRREHPYQGSPGETDAFLYSPAFALVMRGLALLPWSAFLTLWMAVDAAAIWWLSAPIAWRWRGPLLLVLGVSSVCLTNVTPILGVCLVVALTRRSAAWVVPLVLTKLTPGGAAACWWFLRGDWRPLIRSGVLTAALVVATYLAVPGLWHEWIDFLLREGDQAGWWTTGRMVVGIVVMVYAARSGRIWLAGVALYFFMPIGIYHLQTWSPLLVIPRLWLLAAPAPSPVPSPVVRVREAVPA